MESHGDIATDFLDAAQDAIRRWPSEANKLAVKSTVDARGVAQSRRVGASTGLTEDLALGRQIVTMIDASLTHALKSDSSTLVSWRQAKRATVNGVVSRAGVGGAPIVVGGGSPVVSSGSSPLVRSGGGVPVVRSTAVVRSPTAVGSRWSVSNSVVPAAHSHVPVVSNVEPPVLSHVPADVPQGSMAA